MLRVLPPKLLNISSPLEKADAVCTQRIADTTAATSNGALRPLAIIGLWQRVRQTSTIPSRVDADEEGGGGPINQSAARCTLTAHVSSSNMGWRVREAMFLVHEGTLHT